MTAPVKPKAKSVTHDVSEYLFFSPNTKGLSGSPVKIRADLFMDFFCNVDPQTHDGQSVIRDIESLKIFGKTASQNAHVSVPARNESAAHKNRLNRINQTLSVLSFNQSTSPEKTFATKNVRVFYRILQQEGDAFPTVYISDIRVVREGATDAAGLYENVTNRSNLQQLLKAKSDNLDGKTVYVSRAFQSAEKAMMATPPKITDSKPLLFFNPSSVANDLSLWKRNRITDPTKQAIKELSHLLQANQKRNVQWFVEGEGAAVLALALAKVQGNLEKHSFKFLNAHANLTNLFQELEKRKAQLKGEYLDYDRDRTALLAIAQGGKALYTHLNQLPPKAGYDRVSHRYTTEYLKALSENGNAHTILNKAISAKGIATTFIEAIMLTHRGAR
jgi:hypothetical protein